MRPGTLHYVLTPLSSFVAGNHFYALATIIPTCLAAVHGLLADKVATNTEHARVFHYIGQFAQIWYYHAQLLLTDPVSAKVEASKCMTRFDLDGY